MGSIPSRPNGDRRLRSARWFAERDLPGFVHRSALRAEGLSTAAFAGRPVVGICNSWSELVNCNVHFRALADAIKRGVLQAGGLPLEFGTISLGEQLMKPTTMLYRNLMAMDVEESLRERFVAELARRASLAERTGAFFAAVESARKLGFVVDQAYVDGLAGEYGVKAPTLKAASSPALEAPPAGSTPATAPPAAASLRRLPRGL